MTCCFASSSWTSMEWYAGALSCGNSQFFHRQSSWHYDELNCIDSEGSPCILLSWRRWLFPGGWLSLQLQIIQKTPCFISCYDPVEKYPIFVSTISQVTASAHSIVTLVLCQDPWNTVLGNTRHVQVIRQISVASTIANPCCCCDFIYCLEAVGTHQRCNFLDPGFSSNHSCRPVCSSSSKLSLQCVKIVCHLNTALRPRAFSLYACVIIWNVLVANMNTPHACTRFLLGREKNKYCTISGFHVSTVVHNSATLWPTHKIIYCIAQ
jgi:hypothetical protein